MKRVLVLVAVGCACVAAVWLAGVFLVPVPLPSNPTRPTPPVDIAALRSRAEGGDAPAQAQLAGLYARGDGVTNSYAEAATWFRKAADQTNALAQLGLGELYEAGQGVPKDMPQALKLYRAAAEQGLAKAQYTLGFMCESGRGVPVDQTQAAKWFRLAAEQGEPLSQYDLGQRYDLGVGVPVDHIEAYKWLALAAAQGQNDARDRLETVRKNLSRAQIAEAQARVSAISSKSPNSAHSP
jgi:TPR repeat protein